MANSSRHKVDDESAGRLDAAVRALFEVSWSMARKHVERGKISIDGQVVVDGGAIMEVGAEIALTPDAPRPRGEYEFDPRCIIFQDTHILVAVKPAGILTVPFERGDKGAIFDQQIRGHLARKSKGSAARKGALPALMVVQRLDRGTSGVLVFARTWAAKEGLARQLRDHSMEREYRAVVHGVPSTKRIVSHILADRGDGIRGSSESSRHVKVRRSHKGQRAVTNVRLIKALGSASLVSCKLETGRTNQIRIHLSEDGHPLVGERIYMRGYQGEEISAGRLMLHAASLGFEHPVTGEKLSFESELPPEFVQLMKGLRR